MLWEELLVAAFENVHLRIVEAGVVIDGPISFPDETAPETNGCGGQSWACSRVDLREPAPCTHSFEGLGEPQKAQVQALLLYCIVLYFVILPRA